jgi:NDP-sugar pyrophosphorylase family protein
MKVLFFLMAGGYGKRAQPLSFIKPKPAFPLDGTPLISIMLDHLKSLGFEQGFINLHHMPEAIRKCIDEHTQQGITFLYEETLSGSMILKEAAEKMDDEDLLLMVNGDIFLELPVKQMLDLMQDNTDGVVLVREISKTDNVKYRALLTRDGLVLGREPVSETGQKEPGNIAAGIKRYMFPGVALLKRVAARNIDQINMFDSFEAHGSRIKVCPYDGIWLDIGDPASYMEANAAYKKYTGNDDKEANSLSPGVVISTDSQVKSSIIWEHTEIKKDSAIKYCIVTGNMCLEHVRYENRVIIKDGSDHIALQI